MTTTPIFLLAPQPGMTFVAMPSGATYVADQNGIVRVVNQSVADQLALIAAGCAALEPNAGGAVQVQTGTSYTVQSSDENNNIVFSSALPVAVTLPNNAPAGFALSLYQGAAGQVTASAAAGGSVVTPNAQTTPGQGCFLFCICIANASGASAQWDVVCQPSQTGGGVVGATTLANLYSQDTANHYAQWTIAQVFADGTGGNNGFWLKTGALNGSGNWSQQSTITLASLSAEIAGNTTAIGGINSTLATSEKNAATLNLYSGTDTIPVVTDANGNVLLGVNPATGATIANISALSQAIANASTLNLYGASDVIPIVVDAGGNVLLGVTISSGNIICNLSSSSPSLLAAIFGAATKYTAALENYSGSDVIQPIVVDAGGNVILGVNTSAGGLVGPNGVALGGGSAGGSSGAYPLASIDKITLFGSVSWIGLLTYGQSLSDGLNAFLPLSASQPYSNLTFGSGVRSGKPGNTYGALNTSPGTTTSEALVEDNISPSADSGLNPGETSCSGMANWCVQLAAIQNDINPSSLVIFASAAGHGSYSITSLNSGAVWYGQLTDHIGQANALAVAASKTYGVAVVSWLQGEADASAGMSQAIYASDLEALQASINTTAQGATGQTSPVHMLTYQTPSAGSTGTLAQRNAIILAQNQAVAANSRIHLCSPIYHLPFYADGIHLTNVGQLWYGRYAGRAAKQLIIDGNQPDCIRIISATCKGTTLTVKFTAPTLPLVLDTSFVPMATAYGFSVQDANTGSSPITLSNIQVINQSSVQMTLSRALVSSSVVRYALDYLATGLNILNGASGNLRDSTSDTFVYSGTTYPLYHVCPAFQQPIYSIDPNS